MCDEDKEYNICGYTWYKPDDTGTGNIKRASGSSTDKQILAVPNEDAWYKWLMGIDAKGSNDKISIIRCSYARFKLSEYLEFPCDFYADEDLDYVSFYDELGEHYSGNVSELSEHSFNMYKVIPTNMWNEMSGSGMSGPVVVSGHFSRCMDVHSKAKDNAGLIIGLVTLFIVVMFLGFYVPNRIGLNKARKARDSGDVHSVTNTDINNKTAII